MKELQKKLDDSADLLKQAQNKCMKNGFVDGQSMSRDQIETVLNELNKAVQIDEKNVEAYNLMG